MRKKYGFLRFMGDLILGFLTGGLWWIWMVFKFLRNNSR